MNEDLFKMAGDIAHQLFWVSDDAGVMEGAREEIEKAEKSCDWPEEHRLAHYVAIICRLSADEEVSSEEEARRGEE